MLLVPISVGCLAAIGANRLIAPPDLVVPALLRAAAIVVISSAVVWGADRFARRLLPLAALMQLSLVFPDQAPSRFRSALRSGSSRTLERTLDDTRRHGLAKDPGDAARQVVQLIGAIGDHDRRTRGHSERVRLFADLVGEELKLSKEERQKLQWGALLHDLGKLMVPSDILNKKGKPSAEEWRILEGHPDAGMELIAPLREFLGEWVHAIGGHHEKWDGSGYPAGLRGGQIPRAAAIVAVADSFEVMTAVRSYKKAMPLAEARAELTRCAGTHFSPEVVRAFLSISLGHLRIVAGPLAALAHLRSSATSPSSPAPLRRGTGDGERRRRSRCRNGDRSGPHARDPTQGRHGREPDPHPGGHRRRSCRSRGASGKRRGRRFDHDQRRRGEPSDRGSGRRRHGDPGIDADDLADRHHRRNRSRRASDHRGGSRRRRVLHLGGGAVHRRRPPAGVHDNAAADDHDVSTPGCRAGDERSDQSVRHVHAAGLDGGDPAATAIAQRRFLRPGNEPVRVRTDLRRARRVRVPGRHPSRRELPVRHGDLDRDLRVAVDRARHAGHLHDHGEDPRVGSVEDGHSDVHGHLTGARPARSYVEDMTDMNDFNASIIAEFRANDGKVGGPFEGSPMLLLTTTGAKSGLPRTAPLVSYREGDRLFIFASKAGAPTNPDWFHNISANPTVTVEFGPDTFEATATVVEGSERDRIYSAQATLMPGFAEYQENTTRVIPVVELVRS